MLMQTGFMSQSQVFELEVPDSFSDRPLAYSTFSVDGSSRSIVHQPPGHLAFNPSVGGLTFREDLTTEGVIVHIYERLISPALIVPVWDVGGGHFVTHLSGEPLGPGWSVLEMVVTSLGPSVDQHRIARLNVSFGLRGGDPRNPATRETSTFAPDIVEDDIWRLTLVNSGGLVTSGIRRFSSAFPEGGVEVVELALGGAVAISCAGPLPRIDQVRETAVAGAESFRQVA
jgi:hypothetical protein